MLSVTTLPPVRLPCDTGTAKARTSHALLIHVQTLRGIIKPKMSSGTSLIIKYSGKIAANIWKVFHSSRPPNASIAFYSIVILSASWNAGNNNYKFENPVLQVACKKWSTSVMSRFDLMLIPLDRGSSMRVRAS